MPPKFNISKTQLRLLTYFVVAGLVAVGYWWCRDRPGLAAAEPLAPSALPKNLSAGFEVLNGVRVIDDTGNEGDSFRVRHRGEKHSFRLYFASCSDSSSHKRDQAGNPAEDSGHLNPDQQAATREVARAFTIDLLEAHPFAILTRWENVRNGDGYRAFALVETSPGKAEYLSEILVRKGLARISPFGAPLPDGTSREEFEQKLKTIEQEARTAKVGAWRH